MNLALNLPYNTELPDNDSHDFDPVLVYLATGFAFVSLLLVTISCLCCSRKSKYSGKSGLYSREEDTFGLADLLSKPPLADPESVFSELSYDGRVSGAYNSWILVPSEDGSGVLERVPSVMHCQPHVDASRRSLSVKMNNAAEPGASSKKWSSEKHRVNKATRLQREKEKEAKFYSQGVHKGNKSHLPTVKDNEREKESHLATVKDNDGKKESHLPTVKDNDGKKESHLPTVKDNEREKESHLATVKDDEREKESHLATVKDNDRDKESHLPTVKDNDEKKGSHLPTIKNVQIETEDKKTTEKSSQCKEEEVKVKMPISPSGIEESGLKIYKESAKPKTYAFSSAARCSFSHEAGHIANGSKIPRTSLPRTEESESEQSENRKLQVHSASASNISKQTSSSHAEKGGNNFRKYGQHLNDQQMTKSNSDHIISYKATEKSREPTHGSAVKKGDKRVNSSELINSCINSPAAQNLQAGACAIPFSAVATNQNKVGFSQAGDGRGVVMRRSFSQAEGDDPKRDQSDDPAPKCFSLNLQINFHFGSDVGEGQISAECVPVIKGQHYSGDSKIEKIEIHSNGRNLLASNPASKDENLKEKMLEDSFAAKKNNCKYLEIRKRFSEPASLSSEGHVPTSRRYSLATTKPKERMCPKTTLAVHGATKLSNLQKRNVETVEEGQSHGSESGDLSQMTSVAEVENEHDKPCIREDLPDSVTAEIENNCLKVNNDLKAEHPIADQISEDGEHLNNVSKVGTRLQRSKVLVGSPSPKLKGIRKSTVENPLDPRTSQIPLPISARTREQQSLTIYEKLNSSINKDFHDSCNNLTVDSTDCPPSISRRGNEEDGNRGNKRNAVVIEKLDNSVSNNQVKSEVQPTEVKQFKPVALPRRSLPQVKELEAGPITKKEQGSQDSKESQASLQPSSDKISPRNAGESATAIRIPIMIVDDSDEDVAPEKGVKDIAIYIQEAEGKDNHASDESDYDNPWDDLDDAVKRASIRYNRRPSRVALGAQTLFLKSAEDLGRLLEEAEKNRKLRKEVSSGKITSPEEDNQEEVIIPFTRFSPYRHTVKGILTPQTVASHSQSTEDILGRDASHDPSMETAFPGEMRDKTKRNTDPRRPQSMTVKSKSEIPLSDRKRHKY